MKLKIVDKQPKEKKPSKLKKALSLVLRWHIFGATQIFKWLGKWVIIIGIIVFYWMLERSKVQTEPIFNWLTGMKYVGIYLFKVFAHLSFVLVAINVAALLNVKEFKRNV